MAWRWGVGMGLVVFGCGGSVSHSNEQGTAGGGVGVFVVADGGSTAAAGRGGSGADAGTGGSGADAGTGGNGADAGSGGNDADTGTGGNDADTGTGGSAPEGGAPSCADPDAADCVADKDCASSDSECGSVACIGGECVYDSKPAGEPCAQNEGRYCDGLAPAACQNTLLSVFAGAIGGSGDADGVVGAARLSHPTGITYDGAGSLFVADGTRVRRVDLGSGRVTTLAGSLWPANVSEVEPRDGFASDAVFGFIGDVSYGGDGAVYASDTDNHTIRRIDLATAEVTTLAGSPGVAGGSDGVATEASFSHPRSVASDGLGGLWVLDDNGLRRVDTETGDVSSVPAPPCAQAACAGATALASDHRGGIVELSGSVIRRLDVATRKLTVEFDSDHVGGEGDTTFHLLAAAAVDDRGVLYVLQGFTQPLRAAGSVVNGSIARCDKLAQLQLGGSDLVAAEGYLYVTTGEGTVVRVAPGSGTTKIVAGSTKLEDAVLDGVGTEARFQAPWGLVADGAGSAYVEEVLGGLRQVDLTGAAVSTVANVQHGRGTALHAGKLYDLENNTLVATDLKTGAVTTIAGSYLLDGSNDGTGSLARFRAESGYVASDGGGDLWVADSGNRTIRRVTIATGEVTTIAGLAGSAQVVDGVGDAARFWVIDGLVADGGNLYIADTSTIRQMELSSGMVTTLAGHSLLGRPTIEDGVGDEASLISPGAMSLDASGHLYFTDWMTVRRLDLATRKVTTVVGVNGSRGASPGPLPGSLTQPSGLLALPSGDLLIVDESALLLARF